MIIETTVKIRGLVVCISVPPERHQGDMRAAAVEAHRAARDLEYLIIHGDRSAIVTGPISEHIPASIEVRT